ncbi:RNA polymerase sigma factor [Halobacillus seohaensis]|uniref:RNA polymerase sigma factor n=1 Tax=Halobacillus seohaensis TaxID=447421 RepID=A0ABW2EHU5_9BACI
MSRPYVSSIAGVGREGRTIQDERLIKKVLAGNQQATRMLIERYKNHVFKVALSVLRDENHAEDVAQETFIKMLDALPSYKGPGFKTWLGRIAFRKAIDEQRKQKRRLENPLDNGFERTFLEDDRVEDRLLYREKIQRVRQGMEQLPENYKDVVRAYYIEEKSYREMAKEFQLAEKTIEMKLYRARKWMKNHWKEEDFS